MHCINTLLQGPYFSELDLAQVTAQQAQRPTGAHACMRVQIQTQALVTHTQIGHELDQLEQQMLGDAGGPSTNLDESGMFSVQVGWLVWLTI